MLSTISTMLIYTYLDVSVLLPNYNYTSVLRFVVQ